MIKSLLKIGLISALSVISAPSFAYQVNDFPLLEGMLDKAQKNGSSITREQMQGWVDGVSDKFDMFVHGHDGVNKLSKKEAIENIKSIKDDFALFVSEVDGEKSTKHLPVTNEQISAAFGMYVDSGTTAHLSEENIRKGLDNIPDAFNAFLSDNE